MEGKSKGGLSLTPSLLTALPVSSGYSHLSGSPQLDLHPELLSIFQKPNVSMALLWLWAARHVHPFFHCNLLSATDILPVSLTAKDKLAKWGLWQRPAWEDRGKGIQIWGPLIHLSALLKFHLRKSCEFSSRSFRKPSPSLLPTSLRKTKNQRKGKQISDI